MENNIKAGDDINNPLSYFFSRDGDDERPSNREILSYAVGATGQNMSSGFITGRVTYFYENHVVPGASAHYAGKIMTASIVWDAINDILVGGIVDKRRHEPYRKMRPYLLYFPPVIGVIAALMFVSFFPNDLLRLAYLVFCYFIWDLLYSFQETGMWGMLPLSSPHSARRARVTQWVTIGANLGGYLPKAFPVAWDILEKNGMDEKTIFILFAFLFGLGGELLSMRAAKFRERIDSPVHDEESFLKTITVLRHNPKLLLIGAAKTIHEVYPRINRTYFYQSAFRDSHAMGGGTAETLYETLSSVPGAFSVFFANKLIDRFGGMKRSLIISQIAVIAARFIAYGIGVAPGCRYDTVHGYIIMCVIISLSSVFTSFMEIAHRSLINDSIDEVELKTGLRTEGISASAINFARKITVSLQSLIMNVTLYRFLGYKAAPGDRDYIYHQSEKFYRWQYPIFMLGPVIGEALYIVIILFVKDNRARQEEIERLLEQKRRENAENRFSVKNTESEAGE
ncbi:MAG: MFS transporter [Clostridia bacterium]|nr:MFS transporter [Clostridia bacterium]